MSELSLSAVVIICCFDTYLLIVTAELLTSLYSTATKNSFSHSQQPIKN